MRGIPANQEANFTQIAICDSDTMPITKEYTLPKKREILVVTPSTPIRSD